MNSGHFSNRAQWQRLPILQGMKTQLLGKLAWWLLSLEEYTSVSYWDPSKRFMLQKSEVLSQFNGLQMVKQQTGFSLLGHFFPLCDSSHPVIGRTIKETVSLVNVLKGHFIQWKLLTYWLCNSWPASRSLCKIHTLSFISEEKTTDPLPIEQKLWVVFPDRVGLHWSIKNLLLALSYDR